MKKHNNKFLCLFLCLTIIFANISTVFATDVNTSLSFDTAELIENALVDLANGLIDKADVKVPTFSRIKIKPRQIKRYTALGDSTVFGLGLAGIEGTSPAHESHHGFGQCVETSFPYVLAKKLGINLEGSETCSRSNCTKNHPLYLDCTKRGGGIAQLSLGWTRTTDLLAFLTNDKAGRLKDKNGNIKEGYLDYMLNTVVGEYAGLDSSSFEAIYKLYKKNIKASDLISVSVGGNDTLTFLSTVLEGTASPEIDFEYYNKTCGYRLTLLADKIAGIIHKANPKSKIADIQKTAKLLIYGYVSIVENLPKIYDEIHKINRKAIIVATGFYNPTKSIYFSIDEDSKIDIGQIITPIIAQINKQIRNYAIKHSRYCCYVDISGAEVFIENGEVDPDIRNMQELITAITKEHNTGFHETPAGHEYIANQILKALGVKY